MTELAAAGRVELDFSPKLVATELQATGLPRVDSAELRPDFLGVWDATEGTRNYGSDHLKDRAALDARLAATLAKRERTSDDGTLRIDVGKDTPWTKVVDLVQAAATAGYTAAHFAVRGKARAEQPPPSSLHDVIAKDPLDVQEQIYEGCKEIRSYYLSRSFGDRSYVEMAREAAVKVSAARAA